MALQIGQFKNTDRQTYMNMINTSLGTALSQSPFQQNKTFTDTAIILDSGLTFSSSQVYYLTLKIKKRYNDYTYGGANYSQMHMLISLQKNNEYKTNTQDLNKELYLIGRAEQENPYEYFYLDIIFTPILNNQYNKIVLRIDREYYDAIHKNDGRHRTLAIDRDDVHLYTLENLKIEENPWTKMGVQTRPGTLLVVNKEPIRVGRSGIYELNNGTKITSFMIANYNNQNNPFIVDYIYDDKKQEDNEEE